MCCMLVAPGLTCTNVLARAPWSMSGSSAGPSKGLVPYQTADFRVPVELAQCPKGGALMPGRFLEAPALPVGLAHDG